MSKGSFSKNDPRCNRQGRKKTYPQEVIDFISDKSGAMSDKHLSAAINRQFDLSTTRQSVKSLRRYYKIGKGREKYNPCPLLTEKIKDGYVIIKKSNDAVPAKNNWITKHRYLWEQANGKAPKGCIVIFLDGDKNNFSLDNLAVVTKEEQIRLTKSELRFTDPALTQTGIAIVKHKSLIAKRGNGRKKTNAGK